LVIANTSIVRAAPPQGAGSFKPVALVRGLTSPVKLQRVRENTDLEKASRVQNKKY